MLLKSYKNYFLSQLNESKKDMEHLTNLSLRRARVVYDSIVEMQKNSKVDLYGRSIDLVKIEWDILDSERGREAIYNYIEGLLKDMQEWREKGQCI